MLCKFRLQDILQNIAFENNGACVLNKWLVLCWSLTSIWNHDDWLKYSSSFWSRQYSKKNLTASLTLWECLVTTNSVIKNSVDQRHVRIFRFGNRLIFICSCRSRHERRSVLLGQNRCGNSSSVDNIWCLGSPLTGVGHLGKSIWFLGSPCNVYYVGSVTLQKATPQQRHCDIWDLITFWTFNGSSKSCLLQHQEMEIVSVCIHVFLHLSIIIDGMRTRE